MKQETLEVGVPEPRDRAKESGEREGDRHSSPFSAGLVSISAFAFKCVNSLSVLLHRQSFCLVHQQV